MTNHPMDLTKKLETLKQAYAEQLPSKLNNIEACWQALDTGNKQRTEELHFLAHGIAGSGKIFGFEKLGDCAKDIEEILKVWIKSHQKPNAQLKSQLKNKIQALHQIAKQQFDKLDKLSKKNTPSTPFKLDEEQLICIIDADIKIANKLQTQLKSFGFKSKAYETLNSFSEDRSQKTPTALILDMSLLTHQNDVINVANTIPIGQYARYPVIFTSTDNAFANRLNAARYDSAGFFIKPVDITRLIDRLNNAISDYNEEPYRILIVDDDKFLANYYSLILQKHGMIVATASDPKEVLSAIKHGKPELILMDIYMPSCSGIELAKVIRQEDDFLNIPIVFLSTECNIDKQYLAMRMGGDDFLTKPIEDDHLVSAIAIRAKRARALNALIDHDSLTGLLKHTKTKERIASELSRTKRNHSNFAFAIIDIDNFKHVNDQYGHIMGDHVIKSASQILKQKFRLSDNIGRFGGEEFAVLLPDCTHEFALQTFEDLREQFNKIVFSSQNMEFSASLSIGISTYPCCSEVNTLLEAANKALYQAKSQGRNKVILAD